MFLRVKPLAEGQPKAKPMLSDTKPQVSMTLIQNEASSARPIQPAAVIETANGVGELKRTESDTRLSPQVRRRRQSSLSDDTLLSPRAKLQFAMSPNRPGASDNHGTGAPLPPPDLQSTPAVQTRADGLVLPSSMLSKQGRVLSPVFSPKTSRSSSPVTEMKHGSSHAALQELANRLISQANDPDVPTFKSPPPVSGNPSRPAALKRDPSLADTPSAAVVATNASGNEGKASTSTQNQTSESAAVPQAMVDTEVRSRSFTTTALVKPVSVAPRLSTAPLAPHLLRTAPIELNSLDIFGHMDYLEATQVFISQCTLSSFSELLPSIKDTDLAQAPVGFADRVADDMMALGCIVCELYLGKPFKCRVFASGVSPNYHEQLAILSVFYRSQLTKLPRSIRALVEPLLSPSRKSRPRAATFLHQHAPDTPIYFPPGFPILHRFLNDFKYTSPANQVALIRRSFSLLMNLDHESFNIFVPVMCELFQNPETVVPTLDLITPFTARVGPYQTKSLLLPTFVSLYELPCQPHLHVKLLSVQLSLIVRVLFGVNTFIESFLPPILDLALHSDPSISQAARVLVSHVCIDLGFLVASRAVVRPLLRALSNANATGAIKILRDLAMKNGSDLYTHCYLPFASYQLNISAQKV
jgi:hypothetical protein